MSPTQASLLRRRELTELRQRNLEARRERVVALWPTMSVRDIASELDVTAVAILGDAHVLGLRSRPIARVP